MAAYNAVEVGGHVDQDPNDIPLEEIPMVLLFGASHVRRLRDFCMSENIQNFNITTQRAMIETYGIGGMRLIVDDTDPQHVQDKAFKSHCNFINLIHPEVVVLQVGSNDISRTCNSIERCAFTIYSSACYSLMAGATSVVLMQQFPRALDSYNVRARAVNERVEQLVNEGVADGTWPNITFWKHAGLQYPEIEVLDPQGTHLNISGNYRFYRSVRGAILYSTR